jgi:anti-sigma B factor antagonist
MEPFGVEASRTNGTATVAVHGEVDLYTASGLWDAIDAALADPPHELIIDLSDVTFLDSTGLSVLVRANKRLQPRSASLVVRGAGPQVSMALEITKLNKVVTVETADRTTA